MFCSVWSHLLNRTNNYFLVKFIVTQNHLEAASLQHKSFQSHESPLYCIFSNRKANLRCEIANLRLIFDTSGFYGKIERKLLDSDEITWQSDEPRYWMDYLFLDCNKSWAFHRYCRQHLLLHRSWSRTEVICLNVISRE